MNSSKNIASEMEIEPIFREKRIIYRKFFFFMKMFIIRQHDWLKKCIYIYIYKTSPLLSCHLPHQVVI